MDRLLQMIARLCAQRACLDFAATRIADLDGHLLEVGLGKARTYDHLRHLHPSREIYAFDMDLHCPPELAPPPGHLFIGDFRETLLQARRRLGRDAAMAHADFGTVPGSERDRALAAQLPPLLDALVRPRGLVISDRAMAHPSWTQHPSPEEAAGFDYFIYEVA